MTISTCDKIQNFYADYSVSKRQYKNPFTGEPSDNFGLFLPHKDFQELPRPVKAGYVPHTSLDVCSVFEAANNVIDIEGARLEMGWKHGHFVKATLDEEIVINGRDRVKPTLLVQAGYDGKAFETTIGLFRMLCSNGMRILVKGTKSFGFKIPHSSMMHENLGIMIRQFEENLHQFSEMYGVVRQLSAAKVDHEEFMENLLPVYDSKAGITRRIDTMNAIRDINIRERANLGAVPNTAWLSLNAVHGHLQHNKAPKKSNSMMRAEWANNHPLYRQASDLAREMATAA
jgi:hypothetical protein